MSILQSDRCWSWIWNVRSLRKSNLDSGRLLLFESKSTLTSLMFSCIGNVFLLLVPGEVLCTYCLITRFNVFLYSCNNSNIWNMFWILLQCTRQDKLVQRGMSYLNSWHCALGYVATVNLQRVKLIMECLNIIMEPGQFKNIYSNHSLLLYRIMLSPQSLFMMLCIWRAFAAWLDQTWLLLDQVKLHRKPSR